MRKNNSDKVSGRLYGGIGNNLFQICAMLAYSLKHNIDYCIQTKVASPHYPDQKVFFSPNLQYCNEEIVTATVYREPSFEYTEIPAPTSKFTLLDGYFQSEKYFSEYRKEILEILDIPYEFKEGWCSIHVRRGDYLKYPTMHPVLHIEYFIDAILHFVWLKVDKFLIVSDDIEWCKQNINSKTEFKRGSHNLKLGCTFEYSENKTEVDDLSLASSCAHSIGSNSSFSVWVYWLNQNKNKIGVFPQKNRWFGKDLKHNVDDLYMPEWVLI